MQLFIIDGDSSTDRFGLCALSIGFMQSLVELFTIPGDVVLDWMAGLGHTFWAGEFSGRYVIGFDPRPDFKDACETAVETIHNRQKKVEENVDGKVDEKVDVKGKERSVKKPLQFWATYNPADAKDPAHKSNE